MEQDIYFKQIKLFNPHDKFLKVHVYGAGSIGSHVVVGLAKIGIKDITVYDFDRLEPANFPAQFYSSKDSGQKIAALWGIVHNMTGMNIQGRQVKIDESFTPDLSFGSIHIIAFDNIEGRKILFNKLQGFPVHIIDGRIGGFAWEKYYLYGQDDNKQFPHSLEGEFSDLECGMKCLWPVNAEIASKIVADVIMISNKGKPSYCVKGNLKGNVLIVKEEQDG